MVDVIARVPERPDRVAYYIYCREGRPVFGPKKSAALLGDQVGTVLRQLRSMMPNDEFEIVGQTVRFKRPKKEGA